MFIGYFVVGLCALRQLGVQAKLLVTLEDVTVEDVDPKYFDVKDTDVYLGEDETGERTINTRFSLVKQLPKRSGGHFTLFGLSMGEFIVPTGLDVDMTLCEMIDEPILVGPFFRAMGFTVGACPIPPGIYEAVGYTLPMDKLPDEFDENKYQGKFQIFVDGKVVICVKIAVDVQNGF